MKEKIMLLTKCGCSKFVEIIEGEREYTCDIGTPKTLFGFEKRNSFPEKATYIRRVFRYAGNILQPEKIRIFEEQL